MTIKLPDIISGSIMLQNILSIRVLEWIVILIGCEIKGINELDESDSKINWSDYAYRNSKDKENRFLYFSDNL